MKWISEGELEALRGFGKSVGDGFRDGFEALARGAGEVADAIDNLAEALREKADAESGETGEETDS